MSSKSAERVILLRTPRMGQAEHFAHYFCTRVRESGGSAWAGWDSPTLVIRLSGISQADSLSFQRQIEGCALRNHISLSLLERPSEATVLPRLARGLVPLGTVVRERLTKNLLLALPLGARVIVPERPWRGRILAGFSGTVGKTVDDLWREAVSENAAGRLCRVAWPPRG